MSNLSGTAATDAAEPEELAGLPRFLTVEEVADLFRVSRSTVGAWVSAGRIESFQTDDGGSARRLFPRSAVRRFLESRRPRRANFERSG